jgi:hypothetical protein
MEGQAVLVHKVAGPRDSAAPTPARDLLHEGLVKQRSQLAVVQQTIPRRVNAVLKKASKTPSGSSMRSRNRAGSPSLQGMPPEGHEYRYVSAGSSEKIASTESSKYPSSTSASGANAARRKHLTASEFVRST